MKASLAVIVIVLSLVLIAKGESAKHKSLEALSLCELVDNWEKYHGQKVRVRAIYEIGASAWLYDPKCRNGEALIYVDIGKGVRGSTKHLLRIARQDRQAWVILEGVFFGPAKLDNVDPNLPTKLKEGLEKSHKRYGHLGSFDNMIRVSRVLKATKVAKNVPLSKK